MDKKTALIIENNRDEAELITEHIPSYDFIIAYDAKQGLNMAITHNPDLIVLDVMMPGFNEASKRDPDITGYEVCKELKRNFLTKHIPVIIVTGRGVKGYIKDYKTALQDIGADDYLSKPVDYDELEARLGALLRRHTQDRESSPLTGLPGNKAINDKVTQIIQSPDKWAVCYLDIDNFKSYNDHQSYGWQKGDEVIQMTGRTIADSIDSINDGEVFMGHIGGDDFVFIVPLDECESVVKQIITVFDTNIRSFYFNEDLEKGWISGKDRDSGKQRQFPIMTISIGAISNRDKSFSEPQEISSECAKLKKEAKKQKGSSYILK